MHGFNLANMSQKFDGIWEGTHQLSFYAAGRQGEGGANPLLVQIDPTVFDDGTAKHDGMIVTFDGLPSITPPEISGGDPFTFFTRVDEADEKFTPFLSLVLLGTPALHRR